MPLNPEKLLEFAPLCCGLPLLMVLAAISNVAWERWNQKINQENEAEKRKAQQDLPFIGP